MYSVTLRALKDSEWLRQLKEWILGLKARIIMCMGSANERRRYIVTSSLIGWANTQSYPCSSDPSNVGAVYIRCHAINSHSVDNKRSHDAFEALLALCGAYHRIVVSALCDFKVEHSKSFQTFNISWHFECGLENYQDINNQSQVIELVSKGPYLNSYLKEIKKFSSGVIYYALLD